jgi:hypothetical protein
MSGFIYLFLLDILDPSLPIWAAITPFEHKVKIPI